MESVVQGTPLRKVSVMPSFVEVVSNLTVNLRCYISSCIKTCRPLAWLKYTV